ncbi:MAG: PA2169 family four-helix-bundle protein [Pyrinomonadaceae bacterium MAG19_C2-C3]|nr:PA2169 family four-helix-bundle protein [Pyrinomonadaceae bacterium MAG19_C2-C3]
MATNDEAVSTLNNLIETLKDGVEGFRTAADGVTNAELKTLFSSYSQQRSQFSSELQGEVRALGGDPETTGSVAATLHRGWINIKSTVTGSDEHAVLAECERGEDSAVHNYQDAMKEDLPANVASLIQRQYGQIKEAHDRIRSLRDAK